MVRKVKVELTQRSLKNLIKNLSDLKAGINKIGDEVLDEIGKEGTEIINQSLASSDFTFSEQVSSFSKRGKNSVEFGIQGNQAIYEEYGTGTVGAMNEHPPKDSSLRPYNSGETIRPNNKRDDLVATDTGKPIPKGTLYWTYKFNGQKIYTQGRPAGGHVYKASKEMRERAKEIIKRKVGEELSKL